MSEDGLHSDEGTSGSQHQSGGCMSKGVRVNLPADR